MLSFVGATAASLEGAKPSYDNDAGEKLAFYARAWNASLVNVGADSSGPIWVFSQDKWSEQTDDPVWLWAGSNVSSLIQFPTNVGDPCMEPDKRAAVLLRLAINRLWPVSP